MASGPILDCRDLRRRFGDVVAVDGVSFQVDEGETYGLLGPNGAGKTTTISMVCGLLERDGGAVLVGGLEMTTEAIDAKRLIGYVPQDIAVYPDLTGRENLRFFSRLYGMREARARIDEVLRLIGLADRADDRVEHYSGGMKRRLNIGLGLLHSPTLLVLDEPTVGVDPQSRNAILESVERLSAEGMAVLYTTHYMEEAERLCDRVGIIDLGQLKAEGTRQELVGLIGRRDRVILSAGGHLEAAARACEELPAVEEASVHDGRVELVVGEARNALPEILRRVAEAGVGVTAVEVREPNLESVFLHLTGRALRD